MRKFSNAFIFLLKYFNFIYYQCCISYQQMGCITIQYQCICIFLFVDLTLCRSEPQCNFLLCQKVFGHCNFLLYISYKTSVDTEMCCPKGKCRCQYFILLTLKKNSWTQGSWIFFNKKLILDYYFCLKSGPVLLFQIFIIAPLPLPRDIKLYH